MSAFVFPFLCCHGPQCTPQVFSFGMVLLELLTGFAPAVRGAGGKPVYLADHLQLCARGPPGWRRKSSRVITHPARFPICPDSTKP